MATKKQAMASAAGIGAIVGAGIGDKLSPVTYKTTPDMSWGIRMNDGTVGHLPATVEALNTTGHNTAMAIGAVLGGAAAVYGVHRALKNRNLGRQFD